MAQNLSNASNAVSRGLTGGIIGFAVAATALIAASFVTPISSVVIAASLFGGMGLGAVSYGVAGGGNAGRARRNAVINNASEGESTEITTRGRAEGIHQKHAQNILAAREAEQKAQYR